MSRSELMGTVHSGSFTSANLPLRGEERGARGRRLWALRPVESGERPPRMEWRRWRFRVGADGAILVSPVSGLAEQVASRPYGLPRTGRALTATAGNAW